MLNRKQDDMNEDALSFNSSLGAHSMNASFFDEELPFDDLCNRNPLIPDLVWTFTTFDKECQVDDTCFENRPRITLAEVLVDDKSISSCTGLNSMLQFQKLCEAVEYVFTTLNVHHSQYALDVSSRVLLTLMKVKLNLSFRCLSSFFRVSEKTTRETFYYMIDVLYSVLKQLITWPSKEQIVSHMPLYFQRGFEDTVAVIDCVEVPVMKRKCLNCSVRMYSHYKGRHTIKFNVEISPDGTIIGVSKVYGGRASDKHIFNDTKILEKCRNGDAIMCDKGYAIEGECEKAHVKLHRPPFFFKHNRQFEPQDVVKGRCIARARVHIERAIQRIRLFRILVDQIDWALLECIDKVLIIVCALINLSPPIISDDKFVTVLSNSAL